MNAEREQVAKDRRPTGCIRHDDVDDCMDNGMRVIDRKPLKQNHMLRCYSWVEMGARVSQTALLLGLLANRVVFIGAGYFAAQENSRQIKHCCLDNRNDLRHKIYDQR